jgi:hypothetical protein
MNELPEIISLGPEDEAGRLWAGAKEAYQHASVSLVSLCEFLELGIRAAEILIVQQLQRTKQEFPATIALQLETPIAEVDTYRDAVAVPRTIQFTEMLDLLSSDTLDCVGPRLHRGWEDRRFSCLRSRATGRKALGVTLDRDTRDRLLLLAAYRNRLFRYPPPVRIVTREILESYDALKQLVESLQKPSSP